MKRFSHWEFDPWIPETTLGLDGLGTRSATSPAWPAANDARSEEERCTAIEYSPTIPYYPRTPRYSPRAPRYPTL